MVHQGAKLVQIGAKWCKLVPTCPCISLTSASSSNTRACNWSCKITITSFDFSRLLLQALFFFFKINITSLDLWEVSSCGTTYLIISLLCCRVPASHSWTKKKRAAQQNEARTIERCKTSNLYLGAPFMETLEPDLWRKQMYVIIIVKINLWGQYFNCRNVQSKLQIAKGQKHTSPLFSSWSAEFVSQLPWGVGIWNRGWLWLCFGGRPITSLCYFSLFPGCWW